MDADFSHDPRYLPDFLTASGQADVVIGSPYVPGGITANWPIDATWLLDGGRIAPPAVEEWIATMFAPAIPRLYHLARRPCAPAQ